jgi:hypothetical protein
LLEAASKLAEDQHECRKSNKQARSRDRQVTIAFEENFVE